MENWPTAKEKKRRTRHPNNDVERKPLIDVTEMTEQKKNAKRRQLLSGYGKICNFINVRRDDIAKPNSQKFMATLDEVEEMHKHVKNPREQVADAEALLGLAGTLETSVRCQSVGGISPADFVSCLLEKFAQQGKRGTVGEAKKDILWKNIGHQVSSSIRNGRGCCTMLGPMMKNELKQRKVAVYRKRTKPSTKAQRKEIKSAVEEMTDTDKNMLTMFEVLRQKRTVKLENLLLNRKSFAQTVENLFALSFLVKDGRVQIEVDEKGSHIVFPRNAPPYEAVMSREVVYTHFIFRLNFCDWKE